jgi:lipoyl(octanoyl) transferase
VLPSTWTTRSPLLEDRPLGTRCTLLRPGLTPYQDAWQLQQRIAEAVRDGGTPAILLLEHPPVYTLGVRGNPEHLLLTREAYRSRGADVRRTDRGGDVTFHGPGQLVGYPILPIRDWGQGPVAYVRSLEAALIDVLARFGIAAERAEGLPGAWVRGEKIAAIGVRISRGVTTHGFALNVNTDLDYFKQIIPCGNASAGVTSMRQLTNETFDMRAVEDEVAAALARRFALDLVEADALAGVADGR